MARVHHSLALLGAVLIVHTSGAAAASGARSLRGAAALEGHGFLSFIKLLAPNLSPEQEAEIDQALALEDLVTEQWLWDKQLKWVHEAFDDKMRTAVSERDERRRSDAVADANAFLSSETEQLGQRPA